MKKSRSLLKNTINNNSHHSNISKSYTCSQCGACCKLFFINLDKDEYQSGKFETIFGNNETIDDFLEASKCGANFLARKEDGSCTYLENNTCGIHTERPQVCREFFCKSKNKEYANMRQIIAKNINHK